MLPTPTGQPTGAAAFVAPPGASLQYIMQLVTQKYGAARAAQFLTWYQAAIQQDPALSPLDGWTAFETGSTIASGLGTATATLGGIPQAAVTGANNAYKDLLGGFNIGNWFLRIGEILLGLVLVGVGIARITGAQNFISQAVKTKVPI